MIITHKGLLTLATSCKLAVSGVAMAGEIEVFNGYIIGITNITGHYKTKERHMKQFLNFLHKKGINIDNIEITIIK